MTVRPQGTRRIAYFDDADLPARLEGLETDPSGGVRLALLPSTSAAPQAGIEPAVPAGLTVAENGWIYAADPVGDRILAFDPCDLAARVFGCLDTSGPLPGQVRSPRGVTAGPRGALYVSDTGNHRIQVVDLESGQVRSVWGQDRRYSEPSPGAEPGRLASPWATAALDDLILVADSDNGRVQAFDLDGRDRGAHGLGPWGPGAAAGIGVTPRHVLVLDSAPGSAAPLRALAHHGDIDEVATRAWSAQLAPHLAGPPVGLAVGTMVCVGDPTGGRIIALGLGGHLLGAIPYPGPIAALALDRLGNLLVYAGSGAVVRLGGRTEVGEGRFLLGPIALPIPKEPVTADVLRLRVRARLGSAGTTVRLSTLTATSGAKPSWPADPAPGITVEAEPSALGTWRAGPAQANDVLARNELGSRFPHSTGADATYLWVAGRVERGHVDDQEPGSRPPAVELIEIEVIDRSWIQHLPVLYRSDPATRELLEPMLLLFESLLDEFDESIAELPVLMDPRAASDGDPKPESWLDWLSGWVGIELDQRWTETQRREAVEGAFIRHGRRGTVNGLRSACRTRLGLDVRIVEPAGAAAIWNLGDDDSRLGLTTMTTAAEAQGAVLGTTATLDRSHVMDERRYGAPLFSDLAHRFIAEVPAAAVPTDEDVARLKAVLDEEKPAHTAYELCVIDPRMRVGRQARIGIDSIIGDHADDSQTLQGALRARLGPHAPLATLGATRRDTT